ncbi:MAG: HEAT repeat domain-containing protein [Gemmatimonadales bacterium]
MTSRDFLLVVALAQGVFLMSLVVLIILNRWFRLRRRARLHPRVVKLNQAMQRWVLGTGDLGSALAHLSRLPIPLAVDALVTWSALVPGERWRALATALRGHAWARIVRSNSESIRWWKRLECARLLTVAATPDDTPRVLKLLRDPHPAVHVAAVATLERLESATLARAALERLPRLAPTVGAYYAGVLRRSRPVVVKQLIKMLGHSDDPALPRLVDFAARLNEPALRERLTALAAHADSEVRVRAAQAMGAYPHADTIAALAQLIRDPAWPVRAQAARALGMIADPTTLPLVRAALRDPESWVRLRAGLGLTRFGTAGRNALLEAEIGAHPDARDMAYLVLGLSPQALAEYAA